MNKVLLYGAGVGLLGFALYNYFKTQSQLLMNYEYKIVGIKIKKLSLEQIIFDLTIRFINKSSIQASINKIYLDFYVEGTNVGFLTEEKEFIIPSNGQSDVPLTFYFNPQSVLKNAVNIVLGTVGKKDVNLRIKGYAKIKSGLITTSVPIDYSTTLRTYLGK